MAGLGDFSGLVSGLLGAAALGESQQDWNNLQRQALPVQGWQQDYARAALVTNAIGTAIMVPLPASLAAPYMASPPPDTALAWLDRRVNEMRVRL